MAKKTYTKEERKAQFLKTGIAIAKKSGLDSVTAVAVAAKHEVTAPLVFHIFGTRDNLREAIKREAKKQGVTLAEPKPKKVARKRSVAEVKAIKDKAAGKRPARAATGKRKVSRSAKDGKVTVEATPDTTVAQTKKYPTQPVPTINMMDGGPKATI